MIETPFTLPCGTTLKNRVIKAAMTERLCRSDHLPFAPHFKLYDHWASTGSAALLTGNILVDKRYLESTGNVVVEKGTDKKPFQTWAETVTKQDCHLWAQISHAGRQSSKFSTRKPVSASDVQLKKMGLFAKPVPLNDSGIEDVIQRFVYTATFCRECGFTGVQFHAAHGYLLSQFLSPKTNRRTDKWGGVLENRARILFEIVEQTRKALGPDYPISVKLNSADFQRGGFDETDSLRVIQSLEKRGVDLLEISGGTYERSAMMGIGMKESTKSREAYFLDFARDIRKHISVPLMVTGGFRSLMVSERALSDDALDFIGYARPYLMDERFPQGFLDGTMDHIDEPTIKVMDPNNADAAAAGYYDLQIKRLAHGQPLKHDYSALRLAMHIPAGEMRKGIRNWVLRR